MVRGHAKEVAQQKSAAKMASKVRSLVPLRVVGELAMRDIKA
jgi:hypothetical protein